LHQASVYPVSERFSPETDSGSFCVGQAVQKPRQTGKLSISYRNRCCFGGFADFSAGFALFFKKNARLRQSKTA
jgi:hypothetical protein